MCRTSMWLLVYVCFALVCGVKSQSDQDVVENYVKTHGNETFREPSGYLRYRYIVSEIGGGSVYLFAY